MTTLRASLAFVAALVVAASASMAQGAAKVVAAPDTVISGARFAEPLIRTSSTSGTEDAALAAAVETYEARTRPDDLSALAAYASDYPHSGWSVAVLTDLGLAYMHDGYFSRATAAWRQAYALGKDAKDPHARALVDRDIGELARFYSSVGQFDTLAAFFKEVGHRPITGSATEEVQAAREELALVTKDPRHLFNCGPIALELMMRAANPKDRSGDFLQWYQVGPKGTSLAELAGLADRANLSYRLVYRAPGQPVPDLAVVHWKAGHYAAIVGKAANGRYHIEDAAFPESGLWVTPAALDEESSGYFLVPTTVAMDSAWRPVAADEAGKVWGKGPTNGSPPGTHGPPPCPGNSKDVSVTGQALCTPPCTSPGLCKPPCHPNECCPDGGMCGYSIDETTVGVLLSDTPVGYAPPIGPNTKVTIAYSQREDSQPAAFNYYNVSPKWTLNWLTFITDDPTNPGASVSRYLSGGGAYYFSGYNSGTGQFATDTDDGSILVLASSSPVTYQRRLKDGSVETYAQSDGGTSFPRRIFLTKVTDPQGNSVTLSYDGQQRLTMLTDAVGRQTTFSYGLAGDPLLLTGITDPFGRSAALTYDGYGRLASITDVLGLTSSFTYDSNSLVDALTTPYGTTTFAYTSPSAPSLPRFVDVTDPLGYHEREEWLEPASIPDSDPAASVPSGMPVALTNQYLSYRDSFHWDKNAYVVAGCTPTGGCDYTKARDTHFLHPPLPYNSTRSGIIESVKQPLENRVWYTYPGQTYSYFEGTYTKATGIGRVLDNGSTQLTLNTYDTSGYFNLASTTDPVGRVTSYTYVNNVDLATVSQKTAPGVNTVIDQYTYNGQHEPLTHVDAAGQTTSYAYYANGQLKTATDPLSEVTTFNYDTSFNLASIVNANSATQASYTYDSFDRILTFTDSEGWTATYSYDAFDRVTKITYPDGTADIYAYNKLDLASHTDRLGRTWSYAYDANERLTAITDPAGEQTLFGYDHDGRLTSRTDPKSNVTQWAYDIEGRLTTKTYADSTTTVTAYENTTSRVHKITDALSQVKTFSYAEDNRLTGIAYTATVNPTPNVSFAYDTYFPRATSMSDGSGTTTYSYVAIGTLGALKLGQEVGPRATTSYTYDALMRVASRTVGSASAETFAYDAIGRLNAHGSDLGSFTLGYLGQTPQVVSRALVGSLLGTTWTYLTNTNDRRLAGVTTTGLLTGQSTGFAYISNAEDQTTGTTQISDATIAYPPTPVTQTATYNGLNQITSLSGSPLTWDANGNLLSDGTRTYRWDAENRLVDIRYTGVSGKETAFAYDGFGRRVSITSTPAGGGSATTTNYVWCGQTLCQGQNSTGSDQREYFAEGEYLPGSPGQSLYYAPDQLGSVRRVFSAASAPALDYDPYGVPLQIAVPATDFTYAGMFYNGDSGLLLATSRPYDPVSGRWLSRDPIGETGGANLYGYVDQDPIGDYDDDGLAGHRKNARPSTKGKHQAGDTRRGRDQGGEKGDKNRCPPRKPPAGHQGPWPPKPPPKDERSLLQKILDYPTPDWWPTAPPVFGPTSIPPWAWEP